MFYIKKKLTGQASDCNYSFTYNTVNMFVRLHQTNSNPTKSIRFIYGLCKKKHADYFENTLSIICFAVSSFQNTISFTNINSNSKNKL